MRYLGSFLILLLPGLLASCIHVKMMDDDRKNRITLWVWYSFLLDWYLCVICMINGGEKLSVLDAFQTLGAFFKYGTLSVVMAAVFPVLLTSILPKGAVNALEELIHAKIQRKVLYALLVIWLICFGKLVVNGGGLNFTEALFNVSSFAKYGTAALVLLGILIPIVKRLEKCWKNFILANTEPRLDPSKRGNEFLTITAIFLASIFLFLLMSGFKRQFLLMDDNLYQWEPIIISAYNKFFAAGHMPVYDFYQMKGMEIADEGYYSLANPVMLLSYLLYRFALRGSAFLSVITVYLCLMTGLGNAVCYKLCRALGVTRNIGLLITLMYETCGIFIRHGYWYYTINNYLIVPLLLYMIFKVRGGKLAYFVPGLVLAFSLLLGNVQYTAYQYMLYAIIMLSIALFHHKKYAVSLLTNVVCGLVLSLPFLYLQLQASKRGSYLSFQGDQNFLERYISFTGLSFFSIFPNEILNRIAPALGSGLAANLSAIAWGDDTAECYIGGFAVCCVLFVCLIVKEAGRRLRACSGENFSRFFEKYSPFRREFLKDIGYESSFIVGIVLSLAFFISFESKGIIAELLHCLPVIQKFEFLHKAYYLVVPLFIVVACYVFLRIRRQRARRALAAVCLLLSMLGIVNNYFVAQYTLTWGNEYSKDGMVDSVNTLSAELDRCGVNRANFRVAAFNDPTTGKPEQDFDLYNKIIRNIGTVVHVFTLNGYENTGSDFSLQQSNLLQPNLYLEHGNYDTVDDFYHSLTAAPKETVRQLQNNAVKYLIFDKESKQAQNIIGLLKNSGVSVVRVFDFMNDCMMVELRTPDSLCRDTDSAKNVDLASDMDMLQFDARAGQSYRLSFTYKPALKAEFVDQSGKKSSCEMRPDTDGYVLVNASHARGDGKITLYYSNAWTSIAFVFAILTTISFLTALFFVCRAKQKSPDGKKRR